MELNLAVMAAFVPKDQLPVRAGAFLPPSEKAGQLSLEDQLAVYFTEPVQKLVKELNLEHCNDRCLSHFRSQVHKWATSELPGDWVIELKEQPYRHSS